MSQYPDLICDECGKLFSYNDSDDIPTKICSECDFSVCFKCQDEHGCRPLKGEENEEKEKVYG